MWNHVVSASSSEIHYGASIIDQSNSLSLPFSLPRVITLVIVKLVKTRDV